MRSESEDQIGDERNDAIAVVGHRYGQDLSLLSSGERPVPDSPDAPASAHRSGRGSRPGPRRSRNGQVAWCRTCNTPVAGRASFCGTCRRRWDAARKTTAADTERRTIAVEQRDAEAIHDAVDEMAGVTLNLMSALERREATVRPALAAVAVMKDLVWLVQARIPDPRASAGQAPGWRGRLPAPSEVERD